MNFTVIGGKGFIGGAVVARLRADGHEVSIPERDDWRVLKHPLGHVIYSAGVTADFRSRPFDTMRAHVSFLVELLEHASFESLLYLSSTRIYQNAKNADEDSPIALRSEDPEAYYDLTKLAGEALCHASGCRNVRVARLANVIGHDFRSANFVSDLIRSACRNGCIELRSALDSEKDYLMIDDVVDVLPKIALHGQYRCYNVATGFNTLHDRIVGVIAAATGASFAVAPGAPRIVSPPVNIRRIQTEFGFVPRVVLSEIPLLINEYRKSTNAKDRS
jgi:nucleoside-diphosphate-sugar epimerase